MISWQETRLLSCTPQRIVPPVGEAVGLVGLEEGGWVGRRTPPCTPLFQQNTLFRRNNRLQEPSFRTSMFLYTMAGRRTPPCTPLFQQNTLFRRNNRLQEPSFRTSMFLYTMVRFEGVCVMGMKEEGSCRRTSQHDTRLSTFRPDLVANILLCQRMCSYFWRRNNCTWCRIRVRSIGIPVDSDQRRFEDQK